MASWSVHEAAKRFIEVIERAHSEGPQLIMSHGTAHAAVLSIEEYLALTALKPDFKAHLLGGPKVDEFVIEHNQDIGRGVEI